MTAATPSPGADGRRGRESPGIENPNVPPNFSTYVRVDTASRAAPLGWMRSPAADGSSSPNSFASTSSFSSVAPGAIA